MILKALAIFLSCFVLIPLGGVMFLLWLVSLSGRKR